MDFSPEEKTPTSAARGRGGRGCCGGSPTIPSTGPGAPPPCSPPRGRGAVPRASERRQGTPPVRTDNGGRRRNLLAAEETGLGFRGGRNAARTSRARSYRHGRRGERGRPRDFRRGGCGRRSAGVTTCVSVGPCCQCEGGEGDAGWLPTAACWASARWPFFCYVSFLFFSAYFFNS